MGTIFLGCKRLEVAAINDFNAIRLHAWDHFNKLAMVVFFFKVL